LGLFLARRSVDHFHYERDGQINRNALTVHATIDAPMNQTEADRRRDRRHVHIAFATAELEGWHTLYRTLADAGYGLTIVPECRKLLRTLHVRGVGHTARETSDSGPPIDIVLLDWLSAEASTCLTNVKRDARTRDAWTVVLLPGGDQEDADTAFELGADDVFVADV